MAERRTGVVYDERCLAHVNPPGGVAFGTLPEWATIEAFERPERLSLTRQRARGKRRAGLGERARGAPGDRGRAGARALARRTWRACSRPRRGPEPVELGGDAWTGPGTHDAMLLAAGGLLAAVDAVLDGTVDNAFALLRPPGHHAEREAVDGLLPLQQHGRRGALGTARARPRAGGDRRLGRAPRQRDRGDLPRRPVGADDLAAPGRPLPGAHRRARTAAARPTSTCRCPPAPATTATRTRSSASSSRRCARSAPTCC